MRQIICEKNQATLAPPAAPNAICKNPPHPNQNNQSEPGEVSDGVSITAPAHATDSSPPPRVLSLGQGQYLQWADAMANKQPPNSQATRRTAHPSYANNSLHEKDK